MNARPTAEPVVYAADLGATALIAQTADSALALHPDVLDLDKLPSRDLEILDALVGARVFGKQPLF